MQPSRSAQSVAALTPARIAQVATPIWHRWPYVAMMHRWPYCTGDHIAQRLRSPRRLARFTDDTEKVLSLTAVLERFGLAARPAKGAPPQAGTANARRFGMAGRFAIGAEQILVVPDEEPCRRSVDALQKIVAEPCKVFVAHH